MGETFPDFMGFSAVQRTDSVARILLSRYAIHRMTG